MSDESRNWRDLAIAYIQSGEVGFEAMLLLAHDPNDSN
jgi:hypothetical protein